MKRFVWALVMAAIALPAAVAQDSDIADLKAEKEGQETKRAAMTSPSAQVLAARKAFAAADNALRTKHRETAEDKAVRKANEAVAEASASLREAESKDKARATVAKLRDEAAKARQDAVQRAGGAG